MIKNFIAILFFTLLLLLPSGSKAVEPNAYVQSGGFIVSLPMHIKNGYLFVDIPTEERDSVGKKIVLTRSYLLDVGISNDGNFLPFDSTITEVSHAEEFRFPVSDSRTIITSLVPSYAKSQFRSIDPNFAGVLGYAFVRKYVCIFDFEKKALNLYSTNTPVTFTTLADTSSTHVPYLDDAMINYCHCQFPTMWIDVKAPPLKEGRVHLTLSENQSFIFKEAFDQKTREAVEREQHVDSVSEKTQFGGIELKQFIVGGRNIAARNPRRVVVSATPRYKDLNIDVIGTLAIDVLRKYKAVIIDPTQSKLMFVR